MTKFRRITRADIKHVTGTIDIQMKRARSYMKKRLIGMGYERFEIDLDYRILTADNYLVIWTKGAIYGTKDNATEKDIMFHIFTKDIPSKFELPYGGTLEVFIPRVINPYYNEDFVTLLDNSYNVYIPTSSRHGLNIFDQRDYDSRSILDFMKETAAWWNRYDDGPELVTGGESDCKLYDYVLSITNYI